MKKKVQVTLSLKPNAIIFLFLILKLLRSNIFTNNGPRVEALECKLKNLWGVKHVVLMANGTLPLICMANSLGKGGKIVTTPFSFVATTSAIVEAGHKPVFVDLSAHTLRTDISKLREVLEKEEVTAILMTHTYGIQHEIDEILRLGIEYGVKVFFDASHCFGVDFNGSPLVSFGHASSVSFHATKILSTIEGGALVTNSDELAAYARNWRNFGIQDGQIVSCGQNAKMSEIHALFGLVVLRKTSRDLKRRLSLKKKYKEMAENLNLQFLDSPNGAYMPIVFPTESHLLEFMRILERERIFPRRYFYPSLNELSWVREIISIDCPVSCDLSSRIVCLPSGSDVNQRVFNQISRALQQCLN